MHVSLRRAVLIVSAVAASLLASHAPAQVIAGVGGLSVDSASLPVALTRSDPDLSGESATRSGGSSVPYASAPPKGAGSPEQQSNLRPFSRTREDMRRLAAPSGLFGGVEIRIGRNVHSPRWQALVGERAAAYFEGDCASAPAVCETPAYRAIAKAVSLAAEAAPRKALQHVNRAVNAAIQFTDDIRQHGVSDYWANAAQTLISGRGDCEDYAILKYWILAAIGVPQEAMRLVILRDVRRRADHAVLAVSYAGENLILDNLSDDVKPDAALSHYEPRISFDAEGAWLHGRSRPQIARADIVVPSR